MAAGGCGGQAEELFLLRSVEEGGGLCVGERPWRLNFDGFQRQEPQQERPPSRGLHDCLGVLGLPRLPLSPVMPSTLPGCLCYVTWMV